MNTREFDHISPVLRELGWYSIKHQLLVRDVTQLCKTVNGLAPPPTLIATSVREQESIVIIPDSEKT